MILIIEKQKQKETEIDIETWARELPWDQQGHLSTKEFL